ncbi:MAG: TlpA disulfide reductase family protein [Dongiaceae bacterium]
MIRTRYLVIALIVALAGLVAVSLLYLRTPAPMPSAATMAPAAPEARFVEMHGADFAQVMPVDGKGQPADMAPYRGKKLLVNLWATWCAPCIEELPSLGKLQQELGGDRFQVVTIAIDERDPSKIEPFLAAHGAGNLPVLVDINRTIDKIAKVSALPTSLLIDSDGKAKAMLMGDAHWTCGKALDAVKAFVADGTISQDVLEKCDG